MSTKSEDNISAPELGHLKSEAKEGTVEPLSPNADAVFGHLSEDGPNYRDVGWIGTVALMMKTQIGLGVLTIPTIFDSLGLIPGIVCLLTISAITTWSDYMIGVFKLRHPQVYGIEDVGKMLFGRVGREVLGIAYLLLWIFCAGSGMLGVSIALNAITTHATCTAVFVIIAAIIGFGLGSLPTLSNIQIIAWLGLLSSVTAVFIVTIAVGVQDRPAAAPQTGHWESDYKLFKTPNFAETVSSLASLVFAFCGTPAFFPIVSEMRNPHLYSRSLFICQGGVTAIYFIIGTVVYYFCGSYVASPALGSAGPTLKKVSYGIAIPGLVVTTTLLIHLSAKYIFMRVMRGSKHLTSNSATHWLSWFGCVFAVSLASYIIASAVPGFSSLVSLVGALFGTLMCFQPMGYMWLYDNWNREKTGRNLRWVLMACFSIFVIVTGCFLMIAGTYGAIISIIDSYKADGGSGAWSCADNSI